MANDTATVPCRSFTCEVGKGVMVQLVQVGLALELHSIAHGQAGAAAKAICHGHKLVAQPKQALQLRHLGFIGCCCPAQQTSALHISCSLALNGVDMMQSPLHSATETQRADGRAK